MKKLVLAGLAVGLVAVPVLAQQGPARQPGQPVTRAALQTMVQNRFAQADADRDGFVTKAEAEAAVAKFRAERQARGGERRAERFARLDADRNGSISRQEFEARPAVRGDRAERRGERHMRRGMRGMHGGGFGTRFFERLDADKDGRVSLAEATAAPLARFDRLDADRDGTLSPEERRAARERFRGERRAPRG